jgi:hypothetical protein
MARPDPHPRNPPDRGQPSADSDAEESRPATAPPEHRLVTDGGESSPPELGGERYNPSASERPFGPPDEEETDEEGAEAESEDAPADSEAGDGQPNRTATDSAHPDTDGKHAENAGTTNSAGGPSPTTTGDPSAESGQMEPTGAEQDEPVDDEAAADPEPIRSPPSWYKLERGAAVANRAHLAALDERISDSLLGLVAAVIAGAIGVGLAIRGGAPMMTVLLGVVLLVTAIGVLAYVGRTLHSDIETLAGEYGAPPDAPTPLPLWMTTLCLLVGFLGLFVGGAGTLMGWEAVGMFFGAPGAAFATLALGLVRWYDLEQIAFSPALTGEWDDPARQSRAPREPGRGRR